MQHKVNFGLFLLIMTSFLMCQSNMPEKYSGPGLVELMNTGNLVEKLAALEADKEADWIKEKWEAMSDDERLGQLFMVAAFTRNGASDMARVKDLIQQQKVGGLIMFQGGPTQTAANINYYQSLSAKLPLMIAIDGEWGVNMRLDSTLQFPRQMLMGAIQDNTIIYEFGKEVARQCRRLGIHINFAPVVDVNNNAANPVIGDRSFGEIRENVTAKAFQYMQGMQDHAVIACAKHFPGHGDTDVDSHYDLPTIHHSVQRLDSIELYPFRNLIQQGIGSIMVAHLHIPAIDATPNVPTTLSKNAVQGILKDKLGFEGLIFTDAMGMQGVAKHFANGEADLKAILAGNDILLMSEDVALAKSKIKAAIEKGSLSWAELEPRVKKILKAKYRLGLNNYQPVSTQNVLKDLNSDEAMVLHQRLVASALTLMDNPEELIPIRRVRGRKIATLSIGTGRKTEFQRELERYDITKHLYAGSSITGSNQTRLLNELKSQEIVIVGLHRVGKYPQEEFNLAPSLRNFINELNKHTKVILVVFGNPYSLKYFESIPYLVCAYTNEDASERQAAQAIFGGISFQGRLPVTASPKLVCGTGVKTNSFRLAYAKRPEDVGMNSNVLNKIDEIAEEAIKDGATPGCQVLVVKDGKVAFHKAYGYFTYAKKRKVQTNDIYDLASVTKVAATTLSIMKLYEEGKLDINKKLSDYLPELKGTNKENLIIREILLHQAGLKPWIPFYKATLTAENRPDEKYYSNRPTGDFCIRISEGVFFCKSQTDSVLWQRIYDQDLRDNTDYTYSDLGFYLFTKLVEKVSGKSLDRYVADNFYNPMGLENIFFNPLDHNITKGRIVPTEEDKYFRYQKIHGDVHDMGAAMLGGVSGHAGLFASPIDLAAVFQMLTDGGIYQSRRYLQAATIEKFIAKYSSKSRRGLGFDRKERTSGESSVNVAWQASDRTFGHLGFTGIGAWADPDNKLIYIFLSNRTYPSGENMKLISMNIRSRIHEVCYEAIINPRKNQPIAAPDDEKEDNNKGTEDTDR